MKIEKPTLTLFVVFLVIIGILLIERQKPDFSGDGNNSNKAPEFRGISRWINSEPLTLEDLRGKVVLVDFWTYTCINCIRTLPYLTSWDEKYRDDGLVIVGVHSPEFFFEKEYDNVVKAVNKYNIKYAVAQDNDFATWNAYQNRYWPHKYLIDIYGNIRYDHIGEGAYEETERMIQKLLLERKEHIKEERIINEEIDKPLGTEDVNFFKIRTPEIYLGYGFTRGNFGNIEGIQDEKTIDYTFPEERISNAVYLEGKWKNNIDNMELVSNTGKIYLKYGAKDLNIVAGSEQRSELSVFIDEIPINVSTIGKDISLQNNNTIVQEYRLYNLVSLNDYGLHTIELNITGKGFKIYTFTFG